MHTFYRSMLRVRLCPFIFKCAFAVPLTLLSLDDSNAVSPVLPEIDREFRAAWVATVYNIDWPSKAGLKASDQKKELTDLLDTAKSSGLNAIILQVRPAADALYKSAYEPWSPYVSGEMGLNPGYDPLAFAIEESHQRGLELHAWFNPFRAQTNYKNKISDDHIARTRKDWIKRYGEYLWLDPGNPEVRQYTIRVMMDVVERYDIDGIHIDDYFYPYPYPNNENSLPFPDSDTFERFGSGNKDNWRRSNVNQFIAELNRQIKKAKPWVKFGVSPFGIWKPGIPKGTEAGLDAFGLLYADSRKWLRKGWVDYMMPQLYWSIDSKGQSFPKLFDWWVGENKKKRHLWPGIATDRVGDQRPASEMEKQVSIIRDSKTGYPGHSHWSANSLITNQKGVQKLLKQTVYKSPALVPPSSWLKGAKPGVPAIAITPSSNGFRIRIAPQSNVRFWILQTRTGNGWNLQVLDGNLLAKDIGSANIIAVSGLSLTGELGRAAVYKVKEGASK